MTINPAANLVVVEPIEQAETTKGGVNLPQTALRLLDEGIVREVGPKVDHSRFTVELRDGTHVVYSRYSGSNLKIADGAIGSIEAQNNRVILEDRDILAVPQR